MERRVSGCAVGRLAIGLSMWGCSDAIDIIREVGSQRGQHPHDGDEGRGCTPQGSDAAEGADVVIDPSVELQRIAGFGGINVPGWIDDLTPEQVDTAFGNGPGQIGMSILRVRIPYDSAEFELEVPSAERAVSLGATVMASPWTPPPSLKTNGDPVGGTLPPESYGAYADHLLSFRDFMAERGVPIDAISVQNEPDIQVTYESCDWTADELVSFLREQGPRFGDTRLIAAESYNFNRSMTDPILADPEAVKQVDIIGGHIYGNGLFEYPLARELGKEVWMTEHYTSSQIAADVWPDALAVAKEIHDCMSASFSAYIWWYIRRSYGPITEDGLVSKRGQLLAQYAKFVRPGDVRVAASPPPNPDVLVTAYKHARDELAVVAVNLSTEPQSLDIAITGGCADGFSVFSTSALESVSEAGRVPVVDGRLSITLEAQSATTFVSD